MPRTREEIISDLNDLLESGYDADMEQYGPSTEQRDKIAQLKADVYDLFDAISGKTEKNLDCHLCAHQGHPKTCSSCHWSDDGSRSEFSQKEARK